MTSEELGTSLEQINLADAYREEVNIKFKLADVRGLKDVGDLLDLVARMVSKNLASPGRGGGQENT